jgi:hypothetical protein
MEKLNTGKKVQKLNKLGRFHIYDPAKKTLQMTDTFTDT